MRSGLCCIHLCGLFGCDFGCVLCVLLCVYVRLVLSFIVVAFLVPSVPKVFSCVIVVGFSIWRVLGRVMVCDSISSSSSNNIGLLVILFSFFLLRLVLHVLCACVFRMCCVFAFSMLCFSAHLCCVLHLRLACCILY